MSYPADVIEVKGLDAFVESICKNKKLSHNVTGKYDMLLNAIVLNDDLKQAVITALGFINNQNIIPVL